MPQRIRARFNRWRIVSQLATRYGRAPAEIDAMYIELKGSEFGVEMCCYLAARLNLPLSGARDLLLAKLSKKGEQFRDAGYTAVECAEAFVVASNLLAQKAATARPSPAV